MAGASAHHEQMEDLVAPEILVPAVEKRQLQSVDHAADRVNDAACQKLAKGGGGHGIQDLCKCKDTGPTHPDVEYG